MRLVLIACAVFAHRLHQLIPQSPHQITLAVLPQGLHDTPVILRERLQAEIDCAAQSHPDAILLCYGLCCNGTLGLTGTKVPLILPRTDDCIGLLLGGQSHYLDAFARYSPIYWLSRGWVEHAFLPTPENYATRRADYLARFGEENADYLAAQDQLWTKSYRRCGFVAAPDDDPAHPALAQRLCAHYGWEYTAFQEDDRLLRMLLWGGWDTPELLRCPPGYQTAASGDERLITAVPTPPGESRSAQNPPRSPTDA